MKKLIEAARGLLSGETGIIRQGKALVVTCAGGAMIAGAMIVGTLGTPSPGGAHSFDCTDGGQGYCSWVCVLTGYWGGDCESSNCGFHKTCYCS